MGWLPLPRVKQVWLWGAAFAFVSEWQVEHQHYQCSGSLARNVPSWSAMSWWSRNDGCQWQPR